MSTTDSPPELSSNPLYANQPDRKSIQGFFDAIASRYDLLNHLLSFRLDESWRKKSLKRILDGTETAVLDVGVGTGKYLKLVVDRQRWERAAGIDFSAKMLSEAEGLLSGRAELVCGDFHDLPFDRDAFDLVISGFTLRSVQNLEKFLNELIRVLRPNGKAAFLCLTRPKSAIWRALYYPYLKLYLPLVGGMISGNRRAYQFLSESIQSFQDPGATMEAMRRLGFSVVESHSFSFGMATLIIGRNLKKGAR